MIGLISLLKSTLPLSAAAVMRDIPTIPMPAAITQAAAFNREARCMGEPSSFLWLRAIRRLIPMPPRAMATGATRRDSTSIIMSAAKGVNRPQQRRETRLPSTTTIYLKGCAQAAKTAILGRIKRGPDWPAKARDDADIAAIGPLKTCKSAGGPAGC